MFYDLYLELCRKKKVPPTRAALDIGLSKSAPTKWRTTGATPQGETLDKIASYFGVTADLLLGKAQKEKAPDREGGREIGFDDFTYAMQSETQELTEGDKELLLSIARQLNEARKQKNGENH